MNDDTIDAARLSLDEDRALLMAPIGPVDKKGRRRDQEAARLKAIGWTLEEIAEKLNLLHDGEPSPERVAAAIKRAMARAVRFAIDETRALELQSYDELEATAWKLLRSNNILVQNGRIIRGDDGTPIDDNRFALEVIDRILKIKERRSRTLGLDAPTRAEVVNIDSVDAEIARLEQELARSRQQNLV